MAREASRSVIALCRCLFVFTCLYGTQSAAQSGSFGTLFTTPEEREYLDYLRDDFVRRSQLATFDIQEDVVPDIPVQEDEAITEQVTQYRFGGVMTRRNGNRLVWLNGRQVAETDLPGNIRLAETAAGTVLNIRRDGTTYQLKAGQTYNSEAGGIQESYQSETAQPAATASPAAAAETSESEQADTTQIIPLPPVVVAADDQDEQELEQILQTLGTDIDTATAGQMEQALNMLSAQPEAAE